MIGLAGDPVGQAKSQRRACGCDGERRTAGNLLRESERARPNIRERHAFIGQAPCRGLFTIEATARQAQQRSALLAD